jgi:hypothetical protein
MSIGAALGCRQLPATAPLDVPRRFVRAGFRFFMPSRAAPVPGWCRCRLLGGVPQKKLGGDASGGVRPCGNAKQLDLRVIGGVIMQ